MRRPHLASWVAAGLAIAGAVGLAACSGASPSPEPSVSSSLIGGNAVCDRPTITKVIGDTVSSTYSGAQFVSLDSYSCEDGWASARAKVDTSGTTVTSQFFLRAEGANWIPVSIDDICGPQSTPVPQAIRDAACGSS